MKRKEYLGAAGVTLAVMASAPAFATNGYFLHGYGTASAAMGGVGYALPQDALAPASNPAGLTLVGDRLDLGVDWFTPRRGATIYNNQSIAPLINSGSVLGGGTGLTGPDANGSYNGDLKTNAYIPNIGYASQFNERLSWGIAMYGNGGLQTNYLHNPFAAFQLQGTPESAGVDLEQLFIAPTIAFRMTDHQSIGVSVDLVYQRFKAWGLQAFALKGYPSEQLAIVGPFSVDPDHVTNQGPDNSTGIGYRVGYLAEPFDGFTIGASYQPKIHMRRFTKYAGLFAGHGVFDVPENYGGGIAYRWQKSWVISADVQRINYNDVSSVGRPLQPFVDGAKLGADDGPGFGWRNMTIYKFGAAYQVFKPLLLRIGYSYGRQPIPADQTLFNILAPGVIEQHYTAGALINLGHGYDLSLSYLYAPEKTVRGKNSIPGGTVLDLPPKNFGGGEADIHLKEQTVGVALTVHFN